MNKGKPRANDEDRVIGARIRQARIMAGLTQAQLAERIGVTYQQLHKRETGKNRVPVASLRLTAAACGIQLEDLLDIDDEPALVTGNRGRIMIRLHTATQELDDDLLLRIVQIVEGMVAGFSDDTEKAVGDGARL